MKRVHVSSVANAGEDERVEFKGEVHTRALQQGQCMANVKSIVVPQQFRNSSAEMWVAAQGDDAQLYEMVSPTSTGDFTAASGLVQASHDLDEIEFLVNPATGQKIFWKETTESGKTFYRLKHSEHLGDGEKGENAFTQIRPAKWSSDQEAISNINSALRCAVMNSYNNNSLSGYKLSKIPLDSSGNVLELAMQNEKVVDYALEFYFFSNKAQTIELTLKFVARDKLVTSAPADLTSSFCRLGRFTMEAKKWYRITPYDVYEKIEETTATSKSSQIAAAYHRAKEVRKDGFLRSESDIYGSATSRMDIYQNVSLVDKKVVTGTALEADIFEGALFAAEYQAPSFTSFFPSQYLPELPQLQKVMSPTGPLVDLRMDRLVRNFNIVFNDTMKYRLQLSDEKIVADSQRAVGEFQSDGGTGNIIGRQDLIKLVDVQRSRLYPIFNDVYDVSIQKGDEVGRVKVKRGKTARATSDIVHFRQSGSTSAYPENMLIDGQSSIDMGSNAVDQTGFITLHNPLTLEDERLPLRNKLKGNAVATMDVDLVNVEQ